MAGETGLGQSNLYTGIKKDGFNLFDKGSLL